MKKKKKSHSNDCSKPKQNLRSSYSYKYIKFCHSKNKEKVRFFLFFYYHSLLFFSPYFSSISSTGEGWEATSASSERSSANLFFVFDSDRAVWSRPHRSRWIEAPPQELPHSGDQMNGRIHWRRGAELLAKVHVPSQGLVHADQPLRPVDLVFHCFRAEAADPTTVIPLPDSCDVRRCAFLRQTAAIAFCELHFHLPAAAAAHPIRTDGWGLNLSLRLRFRCRDGHRIADYSRRHRSNQIVRGFIFRALQILDRNGFFCLLRIRISHMIPLPFRNPFFPFHLSFSQKTSDSPSPSSFSATGETDMARIKDISPCLSI